MHSSRPRPLRGLTLINTRPVGGARGLSRAARALGARVLPLPGSSLRGADAPAAAARALDAAAGADVVVYTSPAAVRFALGLRPRWRARRARLFGVGPATVRALGRRGLAAQAPGQRFDSEGVLAALAALELRRAAVVCAPGGRELIASALRARGVAVDEIHVYRRQPARLDARHLGPLRAARGRLVLLLSSAESLANLRAGLPADAWSRLAGSAVVASSPRLAEAARAAGLREPIVAASAMTRDLLAAAARVAR
jgi:uroporphyrinogen-III synthase